MFGENWALTDRKENIKSIYVLNDVFCQLFSSVAKLFQVLNASTSLQMKRKLVSGAILLIKEFTWNQLTH